MKRFDRNPAASGEPPSAPLGGLETAWRFGGPGQLTIHLAMVAKLIDRYLARRLAAECGLNIAQWRLLSMLRFEQAATLRELALQAWVDRGDVSRALAVLEKRGLVRRREDPLDRRSPHFSITDAGLALHSKFHPVWNDFLEKFNAAVDAKSVPIIDAALEAFATTCLDLLEER